MEAHQEPKQMEPSQQQQEGKHTYSEPKLLITTELTKEKDEQGRSVYNSKYVVLDTIYSSSLAKIQLACLVGQPDTKVAIKVLKKGLLRSKKEYVRRKNGKGMEVHTQLMKVMESEIAAIKRISEHPNTINVLEIIDDEGLADKLLIVMEYCELGQIIKWKEEKHLFEPADWVPVKNGFACEETIRQCIRDVATGLKFLHANGVMHRDIKPQNILVNKDGVSKICDFGVSTVLPTPDASDDIKQTEGTYHFMSPEECDPDTFSFSGKAIDVWALGVTMYCLLYNKTPFWGETEYQIMEAIRTEDLKLPGDEVRPIKDSTREVLLHLLEKDVQKRVKIEELLEHKWFIE